MVLPSIGFPPRNIWAFGLMKTMFEKHMDKLVKNPRFEGGFFFLNDLVPSP
jgi:hypothetical protein